MQTFTINKHLHCECEYYETRYSWGHKGWLYRDGAEIGYKKITYYNRTWERYTFESLLRCLADKAKKHLTPIEYGLFYKKIETNWAKDDEQRTSKQFKAIAMVASLGDVFGSTDKDKNDWKARMLKAGLPGLEIPSDWETLSEQEKETRLNAVITNLK